MKRLTLIFLSIILLSLASFAVLYITSPQEEKDNALATQGIRLVNSAIVYSNSNESQSPSRIKVGDLLIGSGEQVFKVIQLRKAQSGDIFVVVSWKFIGDYSNFQEFQSEPFGSHKTYELKAFAFNKTIIREAEIAKFYKEYADRLQDAKPSKSTGQIPSKPAPVLPPQTNTNEKPNIVQQTPPPESIVAPERQDSAPRGWERVAINEARTYSTAEIAPDDLTDSEAERLSELQDNP